MNNLANISSDSCTALSVGWIPRSGILSRKVTLQSFGWFPEIALHRVMPFRPLTSCEGGCLLPWPHHQPCGALMCLRAVAISLPHPLAHFPTGLLVFLFRISRSSLYIMGINPYSMTWVTIIFFPQVGLFPMVFA